MEHALSVTQKRQEQSMSHEQVKWRPELNVATED